MSLVESLPENVKEKAVEYRKDYIEWYNYLTCDVDVVPSHLKKLCEKQFESFKKFTHEFVYKSDIDGNLFDAIKSELKDVSNINEIKF